MTRPGVTAAYETARAWAVGTGGSLARPPGLALLVRYGVPAWMREWPLWAPAEQSVTSPTTAARPSRAAAVAGREMVVVLATLALQCIREDER